jgi:hypothetical protein
LIYLEDEGAIFTFGEFALRVAEGLERGAGFGADFPIFLDLNGLPAGARERVDQACKGGGIAAKFVIEGTGAEIAHGFEDVKRDELEGSMIDLGGVEIPGKIGSGFLTHAGSGQPFLLEEPVLMTPSFQRDKFTLLKPLPASPRALMMAG